MTATLIAPETQAKQALLVTLELVGIQTHDREPGSDEWDEALAEVAGAVTAAVDSPTTIHLLSSPRSLTSATRLRVLTDADRDHEEEVVEALVEAVTDDGAGVAVVDAAFALAA